MSSSHLKICATLPQIRPMLCHGLNGDEPALVITKRIFDPLALTLCTPSVPIFFIRSALIVP